MVDGKLKVLWTVRVVDTAVVLEIAGTKLELSSAEALALADDLKRYAGKMPNATKVICPWCGSRNTEVEQCLDCKSFSMD